MPLKRLFAASSVLFLAVLAVSPVKNYLRPYRAIQKQFREYGVAHAATMKAARTYADRGVAVQQVWLPDFENRVDRCTTCHLGVSDAAMHDAPEPFREHPQTYHTPRDFNKIGCTICHGGLGLATTEGDAHDGAGSSGPILPASYVEAGCGRCHTGVKVDEAPKLSHGRALMEKSGCYACHAVRGHEDFRSEAPPLDFIAAKTGGELLRRWLTNPKSVDANATMPNFRLSAEEIQELQHFLFAKTVPEKLASAISAAAAEPAGDAARGKTVFSEARCISCHTVDGKGNGSAPELNTIASRATRGWLIAYIKDPHAFNPRTRMPQYSLTDQDVRDVVEYFESELKDFDAPANILDPLHVNQTIAAKGAEVWRNRGCFACHDPQKGERFGPDLDGIGDRKATSLDFGKRTDLPKSVASWLGAKIQAPQSFATGLKMPSFGFNPKDREAVVTALLALGSNPVPEPYRPNVVVASAPIPAGRLGKLVDQYRCLSCHQFGSKGGDISTAPLTYEGSKVNRAWIEKYLAVPYSMRPLLAERMPLLHVSPDDAKQIAEMIDSFYVDPEIKEDPFEGRPASDSDVAEGQRLYTTYGCRSCHINGPAGGGYYGPPLSDTKTRLKPGWVYSFLRNPQRQRADIRCPNYGLTETDALRITAYLETLTAPITGGEQGSGK